MKIKTRESLKTIKTFDRADTLAQKSKKGVSSLHNSAEQTQNVGYESETDYAGSELQDKEERIARMTVVGANKVGRWGVKETRKNIQKWRNRPRKPKPNPNLKQLPSPQRPMLEAPKKGIKAASKGTKSTVKGTKTAAKGAKTTAKATVKGTKAAVKGTVKAAQLIKRAAIATVKFVKVAVKAIIAAAKAVVAAVKGIIAAIVAGGWVAVLIIVIIVIVACIVGSVYAIFVPAEDSEITIYSVTRDLEREHHEMENELAATVYYDVLNYDGNLAGWEEVIAVYAVKLPLLNIGFLVLAIISSNCAATMMWSRYCPGLRDTGMVSGATGFLDFISYMAASASNKIFDNAVDGIGWENLILVWLGLMVLGILVALPYDRILKRKTNETTLQN